MRESKIERDVCVYAESHGIIAVKLTSPNRRGIPDRMFLGSDGKVLFIEFKQAGEKPRPNQQRFMDRLLDLGHNVATVSSIEFGKGVVDAFIKR